MRRRPGRPLSLATAGQGQSFLASTAGIKFQHDEFEQFTTDRSQQVVRKLRPGGYVVAFGANPLFARVQWILSHTGFLPLDLFHWAYGTGVPKISDTSSDLPSSRR